MDWTDYAIRLAAAMLFGCVIGFERQYHHRMAGLRTNALVALGSASFVMMGALLPGAEGASRVASQVVTGIGFLGGGVILREGLNIRGLNTAATIWCSAAIGSMCGAGQIPFAAMSAFGVLAANVVLRPLAVRLSTIRLLQAEREIIYRFACGCAIHDEARIRALLLEAFQNAGSKVTQVESKRDRGTERSEVIAHVQTVERRDQEMEAVAQRMSGEPAILAISWQVMSELDIEDSTVGA